MSKNLIIVEIEDGAAGEVHHYGLGNVEVITIDWNDMEASAYEARCMIETLAGASQGALGPPPVGLAAINARLQEIIDDFTEEEDEEFEINDEDDDDVEMWEDPFEDDDEPIDLGDQDLDDAAEGWVPNYIPPRDA